MLQYDVTSKKGFVTEKKIGKTIASLWKLAGMSAKTFVRFQRAKEQWKKDAAILQKEDFWNAYLNLSPEDLEEHHEADRAG